MKIIFLDIDGVLIKLPNVRARKQRKCENPDMERFYTFKKEFLKNLEKICIDTKAMIVLSSSWRRSPMLLEKIENQFVGFFCENYVKSGNHINLWDRIIGKTPAELGYGRGHEILTWVDEYHKNCGGGNHISNWVVIDDDNFDMKAISRLGKLVHTKAHEGLTSEKTQEAIDILNS